MQLWTRDVGSSTSPSFIVFYPSSFFLTILFMNLVGLEFLSFSPFLFLDKKKFFSPLLSPLPAKEPLESRIKEGMSFFSFFFFEGYHLPPPSPRHGIRGWSPLLFLGGLLLLRKRAVRKHVAGRRRIRRPPSPLFRFAS